MPDPKRRPVDWVWEFNIDRPEPINKPVRMDVDTTSLLYSFGLPVRAPPLCAKWSRYAIAESNASDIEMKSHEVKSTPKTILSVTKATMAAKCAKKAKIPNSQAPYMASFVLIKLNKLCC